MENKHVGGLIIGIGIVMGFIVWIFNYSLRKIVGTTCTHQCTMYDTIKIQTWVSFAVVAVIIIIGIMIMNTKPKEKIIIKKIREKSKKDLIDLSQLDKNEKTVVKMLQKEGGMFQADIAEKLGIGKVGMTRLLDKLEAKQIIERKRRGMNNIVVLK